MPVRSLSRALTSSVATGVLTLAVSGTALAGPAKPFCDCGGPGTAQISGNVTSGTDVAAPDQQNPIPAQREPVAQQAPTWAVHPQTLTPPRAAAPSADVKFQWDDAGIGAGGALVVVLAGLGGTLAIRRRPVSDPPLPA
jgi:hypothetical protein